MSAVMVKCDGVKCENPSKFRCPTCIKENIVTGSNFCTQECFTKSWTEHKKIHPKKKVVCTDAFPGFPYTGTLRAYPLSAPRTVPPHIMRPDYADHPEGKPLGELAERGSTNVKVLDDEEIEGLKVACKLGREVLNEAAKAAAVGVTTDEIDRIVHEAAIERDCYPSPLNYYEFPKSVCTSVNEVICHGIPDMRPLQNGDLCNVDVTVYHRGFHGDLNETLFIGEVDEQSKLLTRVTYEAINEAIAICKPGVRFREIGNVIQKHVTPHGFSVVRNYTGHGIHRLFHTAPTIPHYAGNKAVGIMKAGNAFTIEPMISVGDWRDEHWPDDWTAVTKDGKRSAQFEQTLLITETGVEILTKNHPNNGQAWFMNQM